MNTITLVLAITLQWHVASTQRVVTADIWQPDNATLTGLASRQDPFSALLTQKPDKTMYWINITIGTPRQQQALQLDTGSKSLWVPEKGSSVCGGSLVDCGDLGSFDSDQSSTFDDTGEGQTIGFVDGDSVTGERFFDTVHIGGQAITRQLAVLASKGSGVTEGVLGVGWPASAQTINYNLAAQDVIASNSYSIWLDEINAASGTILFGGLNLAKFVAPLAKMANVGTSNPTVQMTRVVTVEGTTRTTQTVTGYSEDAVLDTGTSLTVLQKPLADKIISAMGAQYYPSDSTSGTTIIPCSQANKDLSIRFHFADLVTGPTIDVDISQMMLQDLGSLDGIEMCQFGIYVSDGSYETILGDTFLRSAYVVYDLDTNHIGMAQTIFNSGAANIVEIPASGIPVGVLT